MYVSLELLSLIKINNNNYNVIFNLLIHYLYRGWIFFLQFYQLKNINIKLTIKVLVVWIKNILTLIHI